MGGDFDPEKFFRICQRLGNIFSPPAALAPVLKFPEVFVLIAVCAKCEVVTFIFYTFIFMIFSHSYTASFALGPMHRISLSSFFLRSR